MAQVRTETTSNLKTDDELIEYTKLTYHCEAEDIWVAVETPTLKQ